MVKQEQKTFISNGLCFENITEEQVPFVENKLNNRPRKRFGFKKPNEVYLQKITKQEKVAFMT